MKIIHLSDLHLDSFFKRSNIKKTRQVINEALANGFDHLVISGDISDNGKTKDFKLLKKILIEHELLDSNKVTIAIGNHDIFGGVQTALDIVNFPSRCSKINFSKNVDKFVERFNELFTTAYFPRENNYFPFAKAIGDFALVVLNTNREYSKIKNPFASNGKVSREQVDAVKKIFAHPDFKNKRKIVVSHHHFYKNNVEATSSQSRIWNKLESYTLKLHGKKKLIQFFNENDVELVLHGHSHEVKQYDRKGIKFVNAGGSIDNNSRLAELISIDIDEEKMDVDFKKINYKAKVFRKYKEKKKFVPELAH